MDIKATTLVYLRESRRRRKARGMTTSLTDVSEEETIEKRHPHEDRDPEMSVDEERDRVGIFIEPPDNPWHQITDDDQIAHSYTKTLNGNCGIEDDCSIWVGNL